jgi:hypothetical protein
MLLPTTCSAILVGWWALSACGIADGAKLKVSS